MITVGFDMGIRNLAYCVIQHDLSGAWIVKAWDNVDLLEGGASAQTALSCHGCGVKKSSFCDTVYKWCATCAAGVKPKKSATSKPGLPVLPCAVSVKELRPLAVAMGVDGAKKLGKDALIAWAKTKYLMPWKPAKTKDVSLAEILKAMDSWLTSVLPTFASASLIRLENQPVMKGPTMKSVQIMLFTLLSHRLHVEHGWSGAIEFVHAGTKSRGVVTEGTDEGAAYRARKKDATEEVTKYLAAVPTWLAFFSGRSKKSDLADAFLMAHRKV